MIFLRDNVDLAAAAVWAVGSASVRVILTGPVVRPYLFYMTSFFPFFFINQIPLRCIKGRAQCLIAQ